MYKHIQKLWKKPSKEMASQYKKYLIKWRKEPAVIRIRKPTRLDRARRLGYKAKQGIVMARARVRKGVRKKPTVNHARRPKRFAMKRLPPKKSKQRVAEERTSKRFPNLEVLNSYLVGNDSKHNWYEVILVDPSHPSIKNDKDLKWICSKRHRNRAQRGKTSAAKKGRGLRK